MTDPFADLDLDAAAERREGAHPEGIPVKHRGVVYTLPAELPMSVIDTLLGIDLDLASIVGEAVRMSASADEAQQQRVGLEIISSALAANPRLPLDVWGAVKAAMADLFGVEQWEQFMAARPGLPTLVRLARALIRTYGVSLGEAFAAPASSEPEQATSQPTSSGSTASTPEPSGAPLAAPVS